MHEGFDFDGGLTSSADTCNVKKKTKKNILYKITCPSVSHMNRWTHIFLSNTFKVFDGLALTSYHVCEHVHVTGWCEHFHRSAEGRSSSSVSHLVDLLGAGRGERHESTTMFSLSSHSLNVNTHTHTQALTKYKPAASPSLSALLVVK